MDKSSLVKYILKKISDDNITAYAAQVSLFIIMSAVPFLLVFLSLIRFTPISEDVIIKAVEYVIPEQASGWVTLIVDEVYNVGRVLIFSLIFAVYSAAKCIHSLRNGLNRVYEVKETRNWFVLRLRAMLETLVLIAVIILTLLLLVFGTKIQALVRDYFPHMISLTDFLIKGRMIILFLALIAVFTFIYKVIPNRPATWRSQLVGAVGCAISWYVFSFFLSLAIKYLNGFSLYGSITTLVVIMFWLDISMIIFLVCGEVNNAFEMIMAVIQTERMKKKETEAAKGDGGKVRVGRNRVLLQQRASALERKRQLDAKVSAGQKLDPKEEQELKQCTKDLGEAYAEAEAMTAAGQAKDGFADRDRTYAAPNDAEDLYKTAVSNDTEDRCRTFAAEAVAEDDLAEPETDAPGKTAGGRKRVSTKKASLFGKAGGNFSKLRKNKR